MAVQTIGKEYDHISITDGINEVVHYLKDNTAREEINSLNSSIQSEAIYDNFGIGYLHCSFGGSQTVIGNAGQVASFRINPGDTVTVTIKYDADNGINRNGIALSNDAIPVAGNTVARVGSTAAITSDFTVTFNNDSGYKYLYVYYSNWNVTLKNPNGYVIVESVQETDKTVSIENKAADAKAVGDLIARTLWLNHGSNPINENTDLDDIKEYGQYGIANATIANTLSNCPVKVGCRLVVARLLATRTQILYRLENPSNYGTWFVFLRTSSGDGWTDWVKLLVPTESSYFGKRISILGDSISTYADEGDPSSSYNDKRYAKAGDIYTYPGNQCRYPQTSLSVTNVDKTYWMQAIKRLGMVLGVNESWARSMVTWDGTEDTEMITVDGVSYYASPYGEDRYIASQTRINHLGANGTPDIILVNAGTNDAGNNDVLPGTVNYESPQNYNAETIAALPVRDFADAYRTMLIRLMYTYPNAKIICMTPSYRSGGYSVQKLDQFIEIIKEICDMFGIPLIDTRHSGVSIMAATSSGYLPDGTHYNDEGMAMVADLLVKALLYQV